MKQSVRNQLKSSEAKHLSANISDLKTTIRDLSEHTNSPALYRNLLEIGEGFVDILEDTAFLIDELQFRKQNRAKYSFKIPKINVEIPISKTSIFSIATFMLGLPFIYSFYFPTTWSTDLFARIIQTFHKPLIAQAVNENLPLYFNQIDSGYSQIFKFSRENSGKMSFKFYAEKNQEVSLRVNSSMISGTSREDSKLAIFVDGKLLKNRVEAHQGKFFSADLSMHMNWEPSEMAKDSNMHSIGILPIFDKMDENPIFLVDVIVLVKDIPPGKELAKK